ncbi:hypothetical protein EASAB2608_01078 [Streptomyces sp. EAS-AB2608]|nr:hypothetical protein EASAB2608_01078 [Streptomyces sp. EAS-AB2608]
MRGLRLAAGLVVDGGERFDVAGQDAAGDLGGGTDGIVGHGDAVRLVDVAEVVRSHTVGPQGRYQVLARRAGARYHDELLAFGPVEGGDGGVGPVEQSRVDGAAVPDPLCEAALVFEGQDLGVPAEPVAGQVRGEAGGEGAGGVRGQVGFSWW